MAYNNYETNVAKICTKCMSSNLPEICNFSLICNLQYMNQVDTSELVLIAYAVNSFSMNDLQITTKYMPGTTTCTCREGLCHSCWN